MDWQYSKVAQYRSGRPTFQYFDWPYIYFSDLVILPANSRSIRGLTSLASSIWTRIFFGRPTQSLTWLAFISIFICTVSIRLIFLSLGDLLVYGFLIYQMSMTVGAAYIVFLRQQGSLLSSFSLSIHNFSFGIHSLLDNCLPII